MKKPIFSIIICSKNKKFLNNTKKNVKNTIGLPFEFVIINNSKRKISLAKAYNRGIKKSKAPLLVFMHEDVRILTKKWGRILFNYFNKKNIGAVGVAGSNYITKKGGWHLAGKPLIFGQIVHLRKDNKFYLTKYSKKGIFRVVVFDGLFFATKKDIADEIRFDDKLFNGFHFYDIDFSLRLSKKYKTIITTDILVLHYSTGNYNKVWEKFKKRFLKKFKNKLPFTIQKQKPEKKYKKWRNYHWKGKIIKL